MARTGSRKRPGDSLEIFVQFRDAFRFGITYTQCDAHRGRNADRGRSADDHDPDRVGNLFVCLEDGILLHRWQLALIDHHDTVVRPFDGLK
jgi:hypothetical protein